MNTNDWIILKTIKEEGSLTKTAERLYISQPSLTYRLNKLESEFGVTILNRHPNGVSFTIQGEYILQYAEEMIEKLRTVKESVQNMKNSVCGTIRLGISTVFAKYKLAPILKVYHNRFPNVNIVLKTGSSTLQLPEMLEKNIVDIIIMRGDINWSENKHILYEEPCGIVSTYPIEFGELRSIPWIQDEMAVTTKADTEFYDWWHSKFSSSPPDNIIQVNSIEACIQMISQGLGWNVLPKIHITNRRSLHFNPLIWPSGEPMMQKTVMAYRNKIIEQPALKMFIDYVLNQCLHNG